MADDVDNDCYIANIRRKKTWTLLFEILNQGFLTSNCVLLKIHLFIQTMLTIPFILLIFSISSSSIVFAGDEFEDYRCKCVCPSFSILNDPSVNETNRRVYVDVVPPSNCTCQTVVFREIKAPDNIQKLFCPR